MRVHGMAAWLAVGLLAMPGCGGKTDTPNSPPGTQAAGQAPSDVKPLDVSYVTEDYFAAVVVHPRRIAESPVVAQLLKQEMVAAQIAQSGFDLADIEQVVVLAPAPKKERSGDDPMIIIRFGKPVDVKEVLTKMDRFQTGSPGGNKKVEEKTWAGKKCYRIGSSPLAHATDDRTIVFADENILERVRTGGGKGPLADCLREADMNHDAIVAAALEPVKDMIGPIAKDMKRELPPPVAPLAGIAPLLRAATATIDLKGEKLLTVALDAKDAASGDEAEKLLKQTLESVKGELAGTREKMPPAAAKQFGPIIDLIDQAVAGIAVAKADGRVTVTLKRPAGLDDQVPKAIAAAVESARGQAKQARQARQMNNLRQIALAMLQHEQATGQFPAAARFDRSGKPLLSWRVALLPFLDHEALFRQFHLDEPWDSPHNLALARQMPDVYRSEGRPNDGKTSVMVFTGKGAAFDGDKKITLSDITDGTAWTILLVEAGAEKAVPWTKPEDLPFDPQNPIAALGNIPGPDFRAAFFDASVRRIKKTISPAALRALITPSGNDAVDPSLWEGGPR